ncbi:hypothetical protein GCM10028798_12360 [Humibacter antri]
MTLRERVERVAADRETLALAVGAACFVIVALAAMIAFGTRSQPISGPNSLGQFAAIAGAAAALVVCVVTWCVPPGARLRERSLAGSLLDMSAICVAHAVIALLLWLVLAAVAEQSFKGAVVYPLPAVALAASAAAITGYFVFLSTRGLDGMHLAAVLAVFLVLGAVTSMLTATDPHWWQKNLSALGMTNDLSSFAFNLTLIVAGFLVTTIARYATAALFDGRRRTGVLIVRWALVALGVLLGCVGVFPVDRFFIVHNSVACGMVVAYLIITIGLRWFIPELPRAFIALGLLFLAVIVVAAVFFAIGYYNLTAVELVAAVLIFSWLIVFLRVVSATLSDRSPVGVETGRTEVARPGRHARPDIDLSDLDDPGAAMLVSGSTDPERDADSSDR